MNATQKKLIDLVAPKLKKAGYTIKDLDMRFCTILRKIYGECAFIDLDDADAHLIAASFMTRDGKFFNLYF